MKKFITIILTISLIFSCGDENDGDSFVGAADVSLSAEPSRIDTGDRTQITSRISNLHPDGIILIINYPEELLFVSSSAMIQLDDEEPDDISPLFNQTGDNGNFLVFFIEPDDLDDSSSADITFELEGIDDLEDGTIGVDADVNDILIDNLLEFDIENPEFLAEREVNVSIFS